LIHGLLLLVPTPPKESTASGIIVSIVSKPRVVLRLSKIKDEVDALSKTERRETIFSSLSALSPPLMEFKNFNLIKQIKEF